ALLVRADRTRRVPDDRLQRAMGVLSCRGRRHRTAVLFPCTAGQRARRPAGTDPQRTASRRIPAHARRQGKPDLQDVRVHAVDGPQDASLSVTVAYDAIAADYDAQVRGDDWMRRALHTHYAR